ncbi:MAG: hypothetical protein NTZ19_14015 [Bacteroidetes bacterium]|nr:hypothetical protein [Bacteroidota bacterium]
MLVENQNKPISEKLQGFDQIPDGFEFSSDAVWQQLETKLMLQKKQTGFHIASKYLVAASLILAISLMAILLLRKNVDRAQKGIIAKQISQPNEVAKKTTENVASKIQLNKKETNNFKPVKNFQKVALTEDSKSTANELVVSKSKPNIQNQTISETANANAISPVVAVVEKKQPIVSKRLPIIHINELSRAPEPIYSKSNNKNIYLNEVEEAPLLTEHPKPWWQPKPKPINPIISLTDNQ